MVPLDDELAMLAFNAALLGFRHLRRKKMIENKTEEELDAIEDQLIQLNLSVAKSNIEKLKNIPG